MKERKKREKASERERKQMPDTTEGDDCCVEAAGTPQQTADLSDPASGLPPVEEIPGARMVAADNYDLHITGWQVFLTIASVSLVLLGCVAVPALGIAFVVGTVFFRSLPCAVLLGVWCLCAVLPRAPRIWPAFADTAMFRLWRTYFGLHVVTEYDTLPADRQFIMCTFPHGVVPLAQLLTQTLIYTQRRHGTARTRGLVGWRELSGGVADAPLMLPGWRHLYMWLGAISTDRERLEQELARGHNLCLFVGGIAEMMLGSTKGKLHSDDIYIAKRRGFIRLALTTGTDLMPAYFFGNSRIIPKLDSPFLAAVSRRIHFSLVPFVPILRRQKVVAVFGTPIHVDRVPNPTRLQIDDLHTRFCDEIQRIFDQYKHLIGWDDYKLLMH